MILVDNEIKEVIFQMIEMYTKSRIDTMSAKSQIHGYFLLQSCEIAKTKEQRPFMKGILYNQGAIPFKAWDHSQAYQMLRQQELVGQVVLVKGLVDCFNQSHSLTLDTVEQQVQGPSYLSFLETIYDERSCWELLNQTLRRHCSQEAMQVFQLVLQDEEVQEFSVEFAAVTHHDSCKNGLLAHTAKVVHNTELLLQYEQIMKVVDKDLLFIGAALHDIGKCVEYHRGTMSKKGTYASHLLYGPLLISRYEKQIIQLKGEAFYYGLLAIGTQHHGVFGDNPRTLASYLVHLMDLLDTNLTDIDAQIRENKKLGVDTPLVTRDVGKLNY